MHVFDDDAHDGAAPVADRRAAPAAGADEDRSGPLPDRVTSAAQQQGLLAMVGARDDPVTDPAGLDPDERAVVDAAVQALVRETGLPDAEALSVLLLLARTERADLVAVAAAVLADAVDPAGRGRPALHGTD